MDIRKLTEEEVKSKITKLTTWEIRNNKLHKLFGFKTFNQAFSFMTSTAMICEKMNHHPEWRNVYGNVDVELVTHRMAGLTELDFELAEKMDKIASNFNLRKD